MQTRNIFTTIRFLIQFFLIPFISVTAFSQNENEMLEDFNSNFNIYTNNYSGLSQDVNITISAYYVKKRTEFTFTIYKIKDIEGFFSRQISTYTLDVLSKDSLNLLSLCEEVTSFSKTFKSQGWDDYQYFYETVTYKPKEKGAFIVKASYKNKVAYSGFIVTNLGMISEASAGGMLAFTVDRLSGFPVDDVDLSFYLGQKKLGVGKTMNGLFFKNLDNIDREYAITNNISYPLVIGKKDDDIVVSDPYLYFGFSANRYLVYIYTNQPVYRPKSKVDFKGSIRKSSEGSLQNYPEKDITVTIKDSRYAEIYKEVLRTNSFGSFSGEYTIPDNAPLGTYYIYAELEQGQKYSGSFAVEEYKKPEYKVNITLDNDQYTNADEIKGVVQADYYFGSPVQNAEVQYNVYKKVFYKPWWYFSEYRWWYEDYYATIDENQLYNNAEFIYSGKGELGKDGRFDFNYLIKEDFKSKYNYWWWYDKDRTYESDFIYIIQANVTDKSRRVISSTKTVYVTRAQFYLNAKTDKYLYKPDEKVILSVLANDFTDKPIKTSFEGTVNRITWGQYPDYKQKKDFVTSFSGTTRENGAGEVDFTVKDEGYYEININSIDKNGKKVTTETYCYVSSGDLWWWYNQSGAVQIIPDKDSYKTGEVCHALIVTTTPGASVLITTQNDNILSYRVEKIDGTSKLIDIPIEENCTPNFYINAAYVSNGQFYSSSKSVMVIPENKFLTVLISTDKLTYKPKEEGTALVKVVDNYGNPIPNSEVSLGVVDEAIYAIKPDNTKDIRKFFYSPKTNLVYATYSDNRYYYGYSRLITIYERFNIKTLSESELGTVKGRLINKDGKGVEDATIIIDGDFVACITGENGQFEFKLPTGSYSISVLQGKRTKESQAELTVTKGKTSEVKLKVDKDLILFSDDLAYQKNMSLEESVDGELDGLRPSVTTESRKLKKEKGKDDETGMDDKFVDADLRSDFRDAIYWTPSIVTDENGYATVKIKFPDNLTTWRMTARVITDDTKVGQFVNTVITRKDLLVRLETPRFFQEKDEVTISTIIHNYLSEEKKTKLSLKVENLEMLGDNKEQIIIMGQNEEKRIDWKVKVTQPVGFAKLTATALTNEESDAVEVKVPLQPHGLQLAKYQTFDISDVNKTEIKTVAIPDYTDLRSTKLVLNVSPSLASTMLTALDELVGYPYGCVEQTMSRFLPTVIVANAFKDLNAPISDATKKDLPKMVEAGFNRLYSMQHYDGGWGWWTNDQTNPFMTSYVIYGLALARSAGYEPKADVLNKGINSLKTQLKQTDLDQTTRAYMLYSLSFVENKDTKLYEEQLKKLDKEKLNDYAISLLSMAANNFGDKATVKACTERLVKDVQDYGEGGAYWGGKSWHYNWQDDKIQTTAMAVKSLLADPEGFAGAPELLNKAIRWLMTQRMGGGWWNTQSTAFIIYAMVDYLKTSKELEPDYTVKIFLNNELLLDKHMTKEDIFKKEDNFIIEGNKLKDGSNEVRIEKNGAGKVYIASNLTYYTNEEKIMPRENGFRVEREYFKLEKYTKYSDNTIIYRKSYFDGVVNSGDEILVKVRVSTKENNLQYFMLEDPIPAGCEVIKEDWAYNIEDEKDYSGWDYYWWRWWYADKDIRDNRVTFFATYLWGDTYEFTYIMRAQIPGLYNVIPSTGMLMYYPDVRGSSEEMRIEIKD